jgi:addiction module RelE/StbE family toxin
LPWAPAYTSTFRRDYKNLGQSDQQRVNEAIRDILNSDEPRSLGRSKFGKWKGAYGYDVGRAIRILYSVEPRESIVTFLRCGPHTVY